MRLAFHTLHYSPAFGGTADLDDLLEATKSAGFADIGLDLPFVDARVAEGMTVDAISAALTGAGLRCSDLVVVAVGADRRESVATARRMADLADAVGADCGVLVIVEAVPWAQQVATVRECATVLSDHGVRLAIEYTPYLPLASLAGTADLCAAVGWDRAGILLDSLHVFRTNTDLADIAALDGTAISLVQFNDAPADRPADLVHESRHGRLVPGQGALPLADFVTAVRATGYDGVVGAEVLSNELRQLTPAAVVPQIHAALADHWGQD
jgi:sugar phosphate isomerase/epimerase